MIRVYVKQGLMGEGERHEHLVEWRPGLRAADIRLHVEQSIAGAHVRVAADGHLLADDDEVPDGATVLVAADPGAFIVPFLVMALVSAVVSVGISLLIQALTPKPKPPGVPQDRGDDSSPTYAWDGVQTGFGQGFTIPVVYGRHAIGGHVVYTDVFASTAGGALLELLRCVLFLSEGPIYRVGDQLARVADGLGGYAGGPPAGGAIPDHIRVNDNLLDALNALPGARVWLRPGTFDQPPLPTNPFRGATASFNVASRLDEADQETIFTYTGTDAVSTIGFTFQAPSGIYQQDQQGNQSAYPVTVTLAWRYPSNTSWRSFYTPGGFVAVNSRTFGAAPSVGSIVETFGGDLQPGGAPERGPIEIRVRRTTPSGSGSAQIVSTLLWRSVAININQQFAYPGAALIGFELSASGRVAGAVPNFGVRVDGALVRVWDATHGFSARCWDIPAAPFSFMSQPPGRNPAWILGDFLTARWGLGPYLTDDQIDWPALRRWAAFCDQLLPVWNEPAFRCDLVLDAPRPAWEVVLAICATGRAAPIWRNGKLSVVYQYRDAHSDGGIAVADKAPVQLVTSGLCDNVQVRWLQKGDRPTAYSFQFLNADQLYAQDVLTKEDDESAINDPSDPNREKWRPEVVQAWGVTRASQLVREGQYMHRVNRLVRRELTFDCGPWLLAAEVGDLIQFEHDLLRPFGADVPMAMQVVAGGVAVTTLTVDHAVSGAIAFAARDADGKPVHRTVTSTTATTLNGRAATVLAFVGPVTIATGSAIAVGLVDKIVEPYQIVAITLGKDLRRSVRAVQWVPEVFADVPLPGTDGLDEAPVDLSGILDQPSADSGAQLAADLQVVTLPKARHRIGWTRPEARGAARARVYLRSPATAEVWWLLGETVTAFLDVDQLEPWRAYEVAVCLENGGGDYQPPELGARLSFVPEEFPPWSPVAPTNLTSSESAGENLLVLRWDQGDASDLDHYEVRCGDDWAAGQVVYRGRLAEARLRPPPGHRTYQVAARSSSGLYGARAQITVALTAVHDLGAEIVDDTSFVPTGTGGTHSGTQRNTTAEPASPFLELQTGVLSGTFTSSTIDIGYDAPFFLRVGLSVQELDGTTIDDWTFGADSGEARWRTVDTRPASAGLPGIDWSTIVDDLSQQIDDLPDDFRVGGTLGETGSHVLCRVESRTYAGSTWSAWAPHVDRLAVCSRWEARLIMARSSASRAVRARTFRMETIL